MTRILIADDHAVVRSGLKSILEAHDGWSVVAEAGDGKEAVSKAVETKPDVAIIDYSMPIMNGLEANGLPILIGILFILPLLGAQLGVNLDFISWVIAQATNAIVRLILLLTANS